MKLSTRECMEQAREMFREWYVRNFLMIGERGPSEKGADYVFDQVTRFIADTQRRFGG
jgi:hypothetical protein